MDALASRGGEMAVCVFMILIGIGLLRWQTAVGGTIITTFSATLGVLMRAGGNPQ